MKLHHAVYFGVGTALIVGALSLKNPHAGPVYLYPDSKLTPGVAETLDPQIITATFSGKTYSQSHRNVTEAEKKQVYQEYGVPYPQPEGKYEIDHFFPLCAGGSNDIKNLWLEPAVSIWDGEDYGFHTKDKIESYVCNEIKKGKLSPRDAFNRMTKDWVAFYKSLPIIPLQHEIIE